MQTKIFEEEVDGLLAGKQERSSKDFCHVCRIFTPFCRKSALVGQSPGAYLGGSCLKSAYGRAVVGREPVWKNRTEGVC
jgi:hypothetical protein